MPVIVSVRAARQPGPICALSYTVAADGEPRLDRATSLRTGHVACVAAVWTIHTLGCMALVNIPGPTRYALMVPNLYATL